MQIRLSNGNINTAEIVRASQNNKINVPVSPSRSPYAQYKYVRGVPASNRDKAVPVSKLRVLNNLIDSLHKTKSQREIIPQQKGDNLSNDVLDAMIKDYSKQLHQAMKQTAPAFTLKPAATAMAFDLSV